MLRWIKFAIIVALVGLLVYISSVKINNIVLKDINVENLHTIYIKDGFPVYTRTVVQQTEAIFLKDLAIVPIGGKRYFGYVSKNLLNSLQVGSVVFVPDEEADKVSMNASVKPYIGGKVSSINREVDWATGFYKITVTLDRELPKRTFYSAKVVYKVLNKRILVPITMLRSVNDIYYAWLNDNGKAKRVAVKTGICDGYNCEIVSGLKIGDELISSDTKLLKEGVTLRVAKDKNTPDSLYDFKFRGGR